MNCEEYARITSCHQHEYEMFSIIFIPENSPKIVLKQKIQSTKRCQSCLCKAVSNGSGKRNLKGEDPQHNISKTNVPISDDFIFNVLQ